MARISQRISAIAPSATLAVDAKAVATGATAERPVETQFYGDRGGMLVDQFGHRWHVATHVEDVSPDEMARRSAEMFGE